MKKKLRTLTDGLRWSSFALLLAAGIINAIGVTMFLAPVHLYDSGISGTSMLLCRSRRSGTPCRCFFCC